MSSPSDATQDLWDHIRVASSECPLCRRPVEIEQDDADGHRIATHTFPSMVPTPSPRGTLHYPALRVGDLYLVARCPMSQQPLLKTKHPSGKDS